MKLNKMVVLTVVGLTMGQYAMLANARGPSFSVDTKPTQDGGCMYEITNNEDFPLMCHIPELANVAVYVSANSKNSSGSPYGQCPRVTVECEGK